MADDDTQGPAGWNDDERVRRWIIGARQREGQMVPISAELFAAADLQPGEAVLDVGCGTGTTTVQAARAVGASGRVTGSDISPVMIDTARESADGEGITWLVADAQTYDFGDGTLDAVISRFGVMFFPDPVAAFANLARATRPGGRLVAAVWQTRDRAPLFEIPYATAAAVLDDLGLEYEPVGIADNQCSLGSHDRVVSALEPAGWRQIETRPTEQTVYVGGTLAPADAAAGALDVGPIRGLIEGRPDDVRDQVRMALAAAFEPFFDGTGVALPGGFMIVTARR
ncbi:MAG TPA: class I SAM-dependent methyltransferase [Microlunatus sp.]